MKNNTLEVEIYGFDLKALSSDAIKLRNKIIKVAKKMDIADDTFASFISSIIIAADGKQSDVITVQVCDINKRRRKKFVSELKEETKDMKNVRFR